MLCEKNPMSVMKIDYLPRINMDDIPIFKRFFMYLNGCKQGFLKGCRPFIGLDGCHLKGLYKGILLIAISLDTNNNIFHVAFMVAKKENKDSCLFFMDCLHEAIGSRNKYNPFSFMSDKQKVVVFMVVFKIKHSKKKIKFNQFCYDV